MRFTIGGAGVQCSGCGCPHLLECVQKFSRVTLAVHYREKNAEGDYVRGPDVLYQERSWQENGTGWLPVYAILEV